ncbi:MAG: Flp family type IVb pilin [Planctomycetota bacterium]
MFEQIQHKIRRFLSESEGATAVEYAILIGVICLFAISGVMGTGDAQKSLWHDTSSALQIMKGVDP